MNKELLTPHQIGEICDAIPVNPSLPEYIRVATATRIRTRLSNELANVRIYHSLFQKFKDEIVNYYYKTLAAGGEAVGVQVAQSIGERQTQNTLNSIDWNDTVILNHDQTCIVQPVGQYIDALLEHADTIEHIPENRTQYLDVSQQRISIPSVDEKGQMMWLKVEAVTKHLPVGQLVHVKTRSGRDVKATQSKSFLVWDPDHKQFIDKNGSDIKLGDFLPTTFRLPTIETPLTTLDLYTIFSPEEYASLHIKDRHMPLDSDFGYVIGSFLSNKPLDDDTETETRFFNAICVNKNIPSFAFLSNKEFQRGLLNGYFSGNQTTITDQFITVVSTDKWLIDGINFLLYYCGVTGNVTCENGSYTLTVSNQLSLDEPVVHGNTVCDVVLDEIVSIDFVEPSREYVYDFTVEKTRNFTIFNGLCMRDTFHSSGLSIKTVVVGVPRFSELLNATKSPKMVNCLLFLNESFNTVTDVRKRSGNMFTDITVKRLTRSTELIKDEPLEEWHHLFCELYDVSPAVLGWRLRFYINTDVMYEYNVTLKMIAEAIMREYTDTIVLYTPDWKGILDVFVDEGCFSNMKENTKEEHVEEEIEEDIVEEDILEEDIVEEDEDEDGKEDIKEPNVVQAIVVKKRNDILKEDPIPDDIDRIIHMEDKVMPAISSIRVCGIEGIKDIFFEKRKDEWIITTEGSNLYGLFSNPLIDKTKSLSNNMWEIYEMFGIEATRQFLIEEYMDTVSSDGTFVNPSNVELLVDIMVYTGTIISISRYGQKKVGCGPMAKASFEESLENFLKAGINGEKESANGVSASIMLGKMPNIGTGVFDMMVDINALKRHKTVPLVKTTGVQGVSHQAVTHLTETRQVVSHQTAPATVKKIVLEKDIDSQYPTPNNEPRKTKFVKNITF
jgi:DNA-directed RNA polymerase beta' subunit